MQDYSKINEELSELKSSLANQSKKNLYDVPDNYFEKLSQDCIDKINESQHSIENSFILKNSSKENLYELPDNYFEKLPNEINKKLTSQSKIIDLNYRKRLSQISIAASIITIIGIGIYFITNRNDQDFNTLAMNKAKEIIKNNSFDKELNNLNEMDMVEYLKESGHDINAAILASNSSEVEKINDEDFIFDENLLNNYLKDFEIIENNK
jgi:hypothetical protein